MRPSGMRNRIAVLAAMSAFAVGVAGVAVVAARSGDGLPLLPALADGRAADAAAMAPEGARVEYVVEGALADLPLEAPAFRLPDGGDDRAVLRLAEALGMADGTKRKQGGTYTVTKGDHRLTVESDHGMPWFLGFGCPDVPVSSDGSMKAMGCAVGPGGGAIEPDSGGGSSGSSGSGSVEPCPPCPPNADCACPSPPVPSHAGAGSSGGSGNAGASVQRCPSSCPPDDGAGSSGANRNTGASVQACPPCPPDADCACSQPRPVLPRAVPPVVTTPPPVPPADLPPRDEAERIARGLFERLGLPLDTFELDGGQWQWSATLSPPVGGLPVVGREHNVVIGPKGEVVGAHGHLRPPTRIGDYPLVGVQAGLDRLRDGPATGPRPAAAPDIRKVVVTGVHLALQQVDDVLAPVYAFELEGGSEVTAPAVADRYLRRHPARSVDPGVPEAGSASCSAGGAAGVAAGAPEPANQPLVVTVCVEPATAEVGQPVTFTVTAVDPDAPVPEVCGNPTVQFGDGSSADDDCGLGCTLSKPVTPRRTEPQPGKLTRIFTHAYAEPGSYNARFSFQSGPCTEWSNQGEGVAVVVVK